MNFKSLSLETICNGVAPEVFQREFEEVLTNILDPSTDAKVGRKIVLSFEIKPTEDRTAAACSITCVSKLAPVTKATASIFLARQADGIKAYSSDTNQQALFAQAAEASVPAGDGKVTSIAGARP